MNVWLPAIRSGTGTDVFTLRLRDSLIRNGANAQITWFPLWMELFPDFLKWASIPSGTDVIHVNGWAGAAFLQRGAPVVVTVHHLVHDPAYKIYRSVAQSLYHRWHLKQRDLTAITSADAVTAVSGYVANTVSTFSGREDIETIQNWVDTSRYKPATASRTGDPFRLFMPGNYSRRKGFDLLPELALALGKGFEIRCTGGLREKKTTEIENVRWLGTLDEPTLIQEYQQCDAVLSLSRYEGFGYTALEGMACGKPVVGFQTSGLNEVATPDCAKLVPIGEINSLTDAIRDLQRFPEIAHRLGESGRSRALDTFSENTAISAYLDTYKKATKTFRLQK